jgi:hypothetical protein
MSQDKLNGIDFVYVNPDQVNLDVCFLKPPTVEFKNYISVDKIRIHNVTNPNLPDIDIKSLEWVAQTDKIKVHLIKVPKSNTGKKNPLKKNIETNVLRVKVAGPGGFGWYRIMIDDNADDPLIDPYYNDIRFSFKANCKSDLDCKPLPHECPPESEVDFPIDYSARDFWSYRQALLDYASLRYPDWKDRLEADAGVMLAEVMSALGDEMAYYQDRTGREAYLETATQRRSLRHHARLIDHNIHDGLGATTWLDVTVTDISGTPKIEAGSEIWAVDDHGNIINFEVGNGLGDIIHMTTYPVNRKCNSFRPYVWDDDNACLQAGSTELYIFGHHAGKLKTFDGKQIVDNNGKWILLQCNPRDPAIPVREFMLRLIHVENMKDPLYGEKITRLVWDAAQALPFEICLKSDVQIHANLIPVTAGKTYTKYFVTGIEPSEPGIQEAIDRAVEREGRDGTLTYLYSLPDSENSPLVWLGEDPRDASPEVQMVEMEIKKVGDVNVLQERGEEGVWNCKKSLVGSSSSKPDDPDFILDDGTWKRVVGYQRSGTEIEHRDYASDKGMTIRFGDGEFGRIPAEGTIFKVKYRLGGGSSSNVPAASLTYYNKTDLDFVDEVSNPLPAINGMDAENPADIKKLAPEIFRSITYRAVLEEDYAEAAERLDWVQKAGANFRWTGSWLSAFVTPDPKSSVELTAPETTELNEQMDRFRQAGREVNVMKPVYADIDMKITVCVKPDSFKGEVEERVFEKLLGKGGFRPVMGYFHPDNFTFGTLLERSTLEAAIQSVPGVKTVVQIDYRRRGWFDWMTFTGTNYDPGKNAIIRLANDPLHPSEGSLKLIMEGGA